MRRFTEGADYEQRAAMASYCPEFPDYVEDVVLAADTILRVPIPVTTPPARIVVFSLDGEFRCKLGVVATTLALPATTSSDGTGSESSPASRRIPDKLGDGTTTPTHICLRSAAACKGSLAFYA